MTKKMTDFWVNKIGSRMELRIDFDNDRHHAVLFEPGDSRDLVVKKLRLAAEQIQHDRKLDNDT